MKEEIVLLKIHKGFNEGKDLYEATRKLWVIKKERVNFLKYAVGVNRGKVECVFTTEKWSVEDEGEDKGRLSFEGKAGPDSLLKKLQQQSDKILMKFGAKNPVAYLSLSELDKAPGNQTTWIFQGNPEKFDIDGYITDRKYIWWSLRQMHFEKEVRTGDEVFLWRTESGHPGSGGLIARGVVIGPPTMRTDEDAKQYWKCDDWKVAGLGVPIELEEVKLLNGFIPRTSILQNKLLEDLHILRMANQTNYKISESHTTELHKIWGKSDVEYSDDEEESVLFPEGKRVYRKHRIIERNLHLIKAAKEKYKLQDKEMCCMACGFSFVKQYGLIGGRLYRGTSYHSHI